MNPFAQKLITLHAQAEDAWLASREALRSHEARPTAQTRAALKACHAVEEDIARQADETRAAYRRSLVAPVLQPLDA